MLHGNIDDVQGKAVVYNQSMSWGRFYCFVSGQVQGTDGVLLHGAMDVIAAGGDDRNSLESRRSCEMRYTLHSVPPIKESLNSSIDGGEDESDSHYGKGIFGEDDDDGEEEEDQNGNDHEL